jgi:hypothetical protein
MRIEGALGFDTVIGMLASPTITDRRQAFHEAVSVLMPRGTFILSEHVKGYAFLSEEISRFSLPSHSR